MSGSMASGRSGSPQHPEDLMELLRGTRGDACAVRRYYPLTLLSAVLIVAAMLAGCSSGNGGGGATVYSIGGTVTGLAGTGLVLQNNGTDNSPVTANGIFALSQTVAANSAYNVTVLTQPSNPAQVCTVANGAGTATSNVTNIQVSCSTTAFTIGGTVSGLTGAGLVLQDNGGNNLPISSNGSFTFSQPVDLGAKYNVTVLTEPTNPSQICTVNNGQGTANGVVNNVQVLCSLTVSGTVVDLTGHGLVLQLDGANDLPISASGGFSFTTEITFGSTYAVTVSTQPTTPNQACIVLNGSGTIAADVTNVEVICSSNWTWQGGPDTPNQSGHYGTMGQPSATNNPGARASAETWRDLAGNLWLYGGSGYDSASGDNGLGDLWEYSGGQWTWVSGSNLIKPTPVWGMLGVAATTNYPGARAGAATWTDAAGNFWLFGGVGFFSGSDGCTVANPCGGEFNDLWEYSGGEWTWVAGPNAAFGVGSYGMKGVASATNLPPARGAAATWIDSSGDLWLFGGAAGLGGSTSPTGSYNDLWKFSSGEWTWMGGSDTVNQGGTYGTLGTPDSANIPGARNGAFLWVDSGGAVWLFGGVGYDSNDALNDMNDLWKFSGGQWAWMGGPNTGGQLGVYGSLGVAAAGNIPGARDTGVSWIDSSGNLWLFGGFGEGAALTFSESLGDVWKYNGTQWTWVGGSNAVFQPAVYETVGLPGDPAGRDAAAYWIDKSGNVWLFGGEDQGTTANPGYTLSDLWKYTP
jgi:hypothetical protein